MSAETGLLWAAAISYSVAGILAIASLIRRSLDLAPKIPPIVMGAMGLHAGALVARAIDLGAFPITSVHDGMSAFGLMSAAALVMVARRLLIPQALVLGAPFLAVVTLGAAVFEPTQVVPEALRSVWLGVHIALALGGDAALAVAGIVAIIYLIQERRLKTKRSPKQAQSRHATSPHALPALELLDRASVRLIALGFPLMTLGLVSGALYAKQVWGHYWTWEIRDTVSLLVWLLYGVMMYARWMIGWRGRKAAFLTVVGVVAILLTFVGLGLLGVGSHGKDYLS
ncbi:MAG: cytochrome c biogenesis protein CcsA [Myxococcota bacterium]